VRQIAVSGRGRRNRDRAGWRGILPLSWRRSWRRPAALIRLLALRVVAMRPWLHDDVRSVFLDGIDHGLLAHRHLRAALIGQHRALRKCRATTERLTGARRVVRQHAVRAEVVGQPFALLLGGRVQEPHQQEERHHRGDEIGIGYFPRAAMGFTLDHLFFADKEVRTKIFVPQRFCAFLDVLVGRCFLLQFLPAAARLTSYAILGDP
jgi:hypothetical protein